MKEKVSIFMCAYNERATIDRAWEKLRLFLREFSFEAEVFIIDNGSTDGTCEWLRELATDNLSVIFNTSNLGKGGSLRKAIELATGQYGVIYDPDLEYEVNDIAVGLQHLHERAGVLALGSRFLKHRPRYHYLANFLGVIFLSKLVNVLYGTKLTDTATGLKIFSLPHVKQLNFVTSGFDFDYELITKTLNQGAAVSEFPASYTPRTVEQGKKIRPIKDGLACLALILRDFLFGVKNSCLASEAVKPPADIE